MKGNVEIRATGGPSAGESATAESENGVAVTAVRWVDADGTPCIADPIGARSVTYERTAPVRVPKAYRGQRHLSGYFCSEKAETRLLFESRLEMQHLLRLERDPRVVALSTQPFCVSYRLNGKDRYSIPDIFCRLDDGSGRVEECKPMWAQQRPVVMAKLDATRSAVESLGFTYTVVGELPPVYAANLRWLGGYRRPLRDSEGLADQMLSLLAHGRVPLGELLSIGDPALAKPTAMHLLWRRAIRADLYVALSAESLVWTDGHHV